MSFRISPDVVVCELDPTLAEQGLRLQKMEFKGRVYYCEIRILAAEPDAKIKGCSGCGHTMIGAINDALEGLEQSKRVLRESPR